jgi:hypothetical protein
VTRAKVASDVWLPIAFGVVNSNGNCGARTANVTTCTRLSEGRYEITISGENYSPTNYVTVITPVATSFTVGFTDSNAGRREVFIRDGTGSSSTVDRTFHFVVYKP